MGGYRFAANLVILPHGLYYGPVSVALAATAIDAYQRGAIVPERYRGRAGQPREAQEAEYARLGVPLAQALAARHPGQVWETTHVGGHRFAANLVLLPHGVYYGPVTLGLAAAAIDAYQRGSVVVNRYRGRAGQARADQEAEYARRAEGGALSLALGEAARGEAGGGGGEDGGLEWVRPGLGDPGG